MRTEYIIPVICTPAYLVFIFYIHKTHNFTFLYDEFLKNNGSFFSLHDDLIQIFFFSSKSDQYLCIFLWKIFI